MADANTSDFEQWITNRIDFTTGPPLSGDTGDLEQSITNRIDLAEYVEAAAAPPPTVALPIFSSPDAIHSQIFGGVTVR